MNIITYQFDMIMGILSFIAGGIFKDVFPIFIFWAIISVIWMIAALIYSF